MPTFNKTRIDREAEVNGRWQKYQRVAGVELKIHRYLNAAHRECLQELTLARLAEVQAAGKNGDREDQGVLREINARAAARCLCTDWRGYTEDDGPDSPAVPYSEDECHDLFMDVELPFYDDVLQLAMADSSFRKQSVEESLGN